MPAAVAQQIAAARQYDLAVTRRYGRIQLGLENEIAGGIAAEREQRRGQQMVLAVIVQTSGAPIVGRAARCRAARQLSRWPRGRSPRCWRTARSKAARATASSSRTWTRAEQHVVLDQILAEIGILLVRPAVRHSGRRISSSTAAASPGRRAAEPRQQHGADRTDAAMSARNCCISVSVRRASGSAEHRQLGRRRISNADTNAASAAPSRPAPRRSAYPARRRADRRASARFRPTRADRGG